MKRFLMTIALTCVLSLTALAGEMPTCGITSPGEVPSTAAQTPGQIPSDGSPSPGEIPSLGFVLTIFDLLF